LHDNYLVQWVCSLAVYTEIDWNFTIAVGKAIEQQLQLNGKQTEIVNYTNLLKLSRISWMQDGIINESLRIKMLGYLNKDTEAFARETLEAQLQLIERTVTDNSLVKERFDDHKKLNGFLLDVYHHRKTSKPDEGFIKKMLNKNRLDEAQDIYLNEGENKLLWNPANKLKMLIRQYHQNIFFACKILI